MNKKQMIKVLQNYGMPDSDIEKLFKVHKRRFYSTPKGYPDSHSITKNLIGLLPQCNTQFFGLEPKAADVAAAAVIQELTHNPEYPWYWLSKDLIKDLELTDRLDEIPKTVEFPKCAVLVFPENQIKTSTGFIKLICYSLQSKEDSQIKEVDGISIEDMERDFVLNWCGLESSYAFNGGTLTLKLSKNTLSINYGDYEPTINLTNDSVKDVELCQSLLINILIYTQVLEPQVFKAKRFLRKGFGKTSSYSDVLFIGAKYQPANSRQQKVTIDARPMSQWRRGYWNRCNAEQDSKDYEWNFVQPELMDLKTDT